MDRRTTVSLSIQCNLHLSTHRVTTRDQNHSIDISRGVYVAETKT